MNILNKSMIGLVSICGCCTMRVGQRKLRPEVSVASEEYKKQFQTSKENIRRVHYVQRQLQDIRGIVEECKRYMYSLSSALSVSVNRQNGEKLIFQATFLHLNIVTGERKRGCTMAEILVRRQCNVWLINRKQH